jgi:catechol 2,3-dioxygenase-like lactoylglutathione lyase family enzyme
MGIKINGIQQLGIGVENLQEAWRWYRRHFAMDIRMFEDEATAELMLPHTGGKPRPRHAVLALNMRGGGGFEIWQHKGKIPEPPKFEINLGDLGINAGVLKTNNVDKAFRTFTNNGLNILGPVSKDPGGTEHFYLKDEFENLWEVKHESEVFKKEKSVTGGVFGAVIGVKNMEESLKVYQQLLQYDTVIYDVKDSFPDFSALPGGNGTFRRVLLKHSDIKAGAFSPFFGATCIELVQTFERESKTIFENRIWGDLGYIHLCFDINGMDELREQAKKAGYPFTVDSARDSDTFDMGETAGSFAYLQAPEGTLIELVETHKIPLLKKFGWYIDFRKRGHHPLPVWMLNMFRFKRVKDKLCG